MKLLMVPVSLYQIGLFFGLALIFILGVARALVRRDREVGGTRAKASRLGIVLQSVGIALAGLGPIQITLAPSGLPALAGTLGVLLLMAGAIALFYASSRALGRNWSFEARTRSDHELIRHGPYARVRHPIYLGMLLFLLALAVASGHWLQLIAAVPVFLIGTTIRTRLEDRLLEAQFGSEFRDYARSTPALIPRLSG